MSETPSKLRQPRKSATKIDLDTLGNGNFDPSLIENLQIEHRQQANGAQCEIPMEPIPFALAPKLEASRKRKGVMGVNGESTGSPARSAIKFSHGPTMTSVPRRSFIPSSGSAASGRPAVFKSKPAPIVSAQIRKNVSASASTLFEDQESKARIKELEHLTSQLTQQLTEYTQNQASLQNQLQESEMRVSGLESFRKALESRVNNKEMENSEYEQEIQKLRGQIESDRSEATAYTTRIKSELSGQISRLEEEKTELEHQIRNLRTTLTSLEDECASLKGTLNRQSATALELESQVSALKAKLQVAQSEIISRSMSCDEVTGRLTEAEKTIEGLRNKLQEGETVRRKLHNMVQELKGNIRVFCRIRPLMQHEILKGRTVGEEMGHFNIIRKLDDPDELCLNQPVESAIGQQTTKTYPFAFDRVFGPHSSQHDVFDEISQLVQSALDGYRVCIFAYGQTGSGKTHTMEGSQSDENLLGMIPRAVIQVFSTAESLNRDKKWQFTFEASYLEIYNETIRDLLLTPGSGATEDCKHEIRHLNNPNRTVVTDLTVVSVDSPQSVLTLLRRAGENRAVAETLCNDRSSRSHSVFTLKISGSNSVTGESVEGLLNLIDLAGSERLSQSGSTGDRLKETQAINKSLSSLGDVISSLANKEAHIPYRNSKLTFLLQNSLGGNCKTLMFVNVSPAAANFNETLCSLRFATKVNSCQIGTARRNNISK